MRRVTLVAFAILASFHISSVQGHTMNDPVTDCEALMNAALPFAEQMLTAHGEFFPFGSAMRSDGEIVAVAGYTGHEYPRSAGVITSIKSSLVAAVRKGEYKASAVISDVKVRLPSSQKKSDAISVSLNHQDNYSIVVLFPYQIDEGKLVRGAAFAQRGEADIFPTR